MRISNSASFAAAHRACQDRNYRQESLPHIHPGSSHPRRHAQRRLPVVSHGPEPCHLPTRGRCDCWNKGNEGLGYRLFGLYVDGFQIAHRRIKSALAWRLIFRLWANGRHAGGQGIDLHRLGCGRHLHVERIKIHLYERLRLIIVNLGALHRHALLNGRKGAYRGLRRC